jgi:arylsulfatase A-like enzyme
MAALKEMGLDDNTIVIFSSDNGPQPFGGPDTAYFHSTGGLRGLKHDLYEGGIREPMIVRWPGHVKEGTTSAFQTVLYDMMPTFLDVAGLPKAGRTDGVSLVPVITGEGRPQDRPFLYWEHSGKGGQKAVRQGKWKAIWVGMKKDPKTAGELYDLEKDPDETTDVSKAHPDVMRELTKIRDESHEPSVLKAWNF